MSIQDNQCAFCGNTLDQIENGHYNCSKCHFGWDGKPANPFQHIEKLKNLVIYMKTQNPHLDSNQLVDLIIEKLHAIERHPTMADGYCEYCQLRYQK